MFVCKFFQLSIPPLIGHLDVEDEEKGERLESNEQLDINLIV